MKSLINWDYQFVRCVLQYNVSTAWWLRTHWRDGETFGRVHIHFIFKQKLILHTVSKSYQHNLYLENTFFWFECPTYFAVSVSTFVFSHSNYMCRTVSCLFSHHMKLNACAPTTVTISRIDFRLTSWTRSLETFQVRDKTHLPIQIKTIVFFILFMIFSCPIAYSYFYFRNTYSFLLKWKILLLAFLASFKTTTTMQNSFSVKMTAFFWGVAQLSWLFAQL